MAANPAGNPVFDAQNLSNSYTNINGALVTLQAESQVVAQEFSLLAASPPIALAQIQQQLQNILQQLQQLGPMNANIISLRADTTSLRADTTSLRADIISLRAESYNHKARIQNTRVCKMADPLALLHNVNTNTPIPNFPATLQQLSNLPVVQLRTVLGELGVPFPATANGATLKALLRTDIGCAEI